MPNIICNTWKEAKDFILKYPELLNHVMLNDKSIIDICGSNYQMDWSATPSKEKIAQLINHIEAILYPQIKTSGNNEIYKSYLDSPEWVNKKKEILKRDFDTCTRCYNSIKLESLSELRNYLSEDNFEIVHSKCKPYPIVTNNEIPEYKIGENRVYKDYFEFHAAITPHGYISSIGLYLYEYNYHRHGSIWEKEIMQKGIFFSTQNSLPNQRKWQWGAYSYPRIIDYYKKERSMYWQYDELGNTNNKLILSHCVSEEGNYYIGDYRGIGILSYNQYSIIFPLYRLSVPLDVHHKIYRKTNGEYIKPWEYNNDELITLCRNCHTDVHKEPIPIKYE